MVQHSLLLQQSSYPLLHGAKILLESITHTEHFLFILFHDRRTTPKIILHKFVLRLKKQRQQPIASILLGLRQPAHHLIEL